MKKRYAKALFFLIIICGICILSTHSYADVVSYSQESIDEKYGEPSYGHRVSASDGRMPWNTEKLYVNLAITLAMIIAMIVVLKIIMKTKGSRGRKITFIIMTIILLIGYLFFSIQMINKAKKQNERAEIPGEYGIRWPNVMEEIYTFGNVLSPVDTIVSFLNQINTKEALWRTYNYYNNYINRNVDLVIKTSEYDYSKTCEPDTAIQTLLNIVNSKLDKSKKYYLKMESYSGKYYYSPYNTDFVRSITISDERIK